MRLLPLLLLTACGSRELFVLPTVLDFGEVNFGEERPPEGYAAVDLAVSNTGARPLTVRIDGLTTDHLLLTAPIFASTDPPTLPELDEGETATLRVGVWNYELGELTTEVSGTFTLRADGIDPQPIPWSFTPVRFTVEDTASP